MTLDTGLPDGQQPNDDARPDAGAPAAPAAAPAPDPVSDPDMAELLAARAAAEAEDKGGTQDEPAAVDPAAAPAPTPAPAPTAEAPKDPGQQPMVPFARFKQVNDRAALAEQQVAYLQGQVEVLSKGPAAPGGNPPGAGTQPPPTPAPSIADQIAAHRAELKQLATDVDEGKLLYSEFVEKQQDLNDKIVELRVQERTAKLAPPAPSTPEISLADQQLMAEQVRELETKHPYVKVLDQRQTAFLVNAAKAEAEAAGRPYGRSVADTVNLRAHVAALSDLYGPRWGLQPAGTQAPGTKPGAAPQPAPKPGLSPAAAARLAKMDMAAGLPPDTSGLGATQGGADALSEQAILAMTDEEIGALPAAVRAKYLQG